MASVVYNSFKRGSAGGEINLNADDIRVFLVMSDTTCGTENDGKQYVDDFTTLDECDGYGYERKALAGKVVNKDDEHDRAEFDAQDLEFGTIGVGTRPTVGAVLYKHVNDDTDSFIIAYVEFPADTTHDSSEFTIKWNTEGILQFS
jgi:hypothetical protein